MIMSSTDATRRECTISAKWGDAAADHLADIAHNTMQSSVALTVKWKKEVHENISVDLSAPVSELKVQLFSLTGVAPDKQKLILGGKTLKDDQSLESCGAKTGSVLQMMGNAMDNWVKPDVAFTFVEDLSASQQAAVLARVPAGLSNLGNTCYMAATLQSLRSVPELTTALKQYHDSKPMLTSIFDLQFAHVRASIGAIAQAQQVEEEPQQVASILQRMLPPGEPGTWGSQDAHQVVTAAAGALYKQLDASGEPIEPYAFHSALQKAFPQFGENDQGRLMQQDADECFNSFLTAVGSQLPGGLVDNLFGIRQQVTLTNAETDAEPPAVYDERTLNLMCHIEEKDPCSSLTVGLINSTRGSVEKHSALIGRNCLYNKSMRMANLPPFLAVKFVRFQYDSASQKKKKILRQVSYPLNLDLTPIVTDPLRAIIEQKRRKISEQEDRKKQALLSVAPADAAAAPECAAEPDEADALSSPTGMYELVAVVCHQVLLQRLLWPVPCAISLTFMNLGAHGRLRTLHWIWKDCGWPVDSVQRRPRARNEGACTSTACFARHLHMLQCDIFFAAHSGAGGCNSQARWWRWGQSDCIHLHLQSEEVGHKVVAAFCDCQCIANHFAPVLTINSLSSTF